MHDPHLKNFFFVVLAIIFFFSKFYSDLGTNGGEARNKPTVHSEYKPLYLQGKPKVSHHSSISFITAIKAH